MYQQMFELHAELLNALAQPKRLEIVQLLRNKKMNVSEMVEMLGLPQANLSQHLMTLRKAKVVKTTRNGKQVFYELTSNKFVKASDLLREVLIERHKDSSLADELTLKMTELVPVIHDPVCGMRVSPKTAAYAKKYAGLDYYFCAEGCLHKFNKKPGQYLVIKK